MNKLAVLTVNYRNYKVTEEFLSSFKQQTNKDFQIYIADVTTEKEREELKVSDVRYKVLIRENNGYAFGINEAIREAQKEGYENFAVINNDTEVSDTFVDDALRSISEHPNSLIGGKIYYYPGYEYHSDRYAKKDNGKVFWYAGGIIDWDNVVTKHRGVDEVDNGQFDKVSETDFVTGCLMMFDNDLINRAGFMNESYFLYYEDADWCERIKRAGRKLYFDPSVVIWHKNAQSSGGSGSDLHARYQRKNRLIYGLKYAPMRTKLHLIKNHLLGK